MRSSAEVRLRPALEEDLDSILAVESSWETTPHWTREQFVVELGSQRSLFLEAEGAGVSAQRRVASAAQSLGHEPDRRHAAQHGGR